MIEKLIRWLMPAYFRALQEQQDMLARVHKNQLASFNLLNRELQSVHRSVKAADERIAAAHKELKTLCEEIIECQPIAKRKTAMPPLRGLPGADFPAKIQSIDSAYPRRLR